MRSRMDTWDAGSVIAIPGTSVAYRLVAKRGSGASADVWEAEGPNGARVALRIARGTVERLQGELQAIDVVRGVRHPHLLTVFGAWPRDGGLVVGMELADRSLWDRFTEATAEGLVGIPRRELLGYLDGVASALDELNAPRHVVGAREGLAIQHRDVTPRNILLFGHTAKLGGFGNARVLDGQPPNRANWTVAYAAPELFAGKVAAQSDQYGLAVTYCQMRGGHLPFHGNVAEVMAGQMFATPELRTLPERERAIVARALAKAPDQRWPSCQAFLNALAGAEESDTLDRLPADATADADPLDALPAPNRGAPSLEDFSGTHNLVFDLSYDTLPGAPSGIGPVSDFLICPPSRNEARTAASAAKEGLSDFVVCPPSRDDWPALESGEFSAVSDFQVMSQRSEETARWPEPPSHAAASAPGGGGPGGLLIPLVFLACAAAVAFLVLGPRVLRDRLRGPEQGLTVALAPPAPGPATAPLSRPPAPVPPAASHPETTDAPSAERAEGIASRSPVTTEARSRPPAEPAAGEVPAPAEATPEPAAAAVALRPAGRDAVRDEPARAAEPAAPAEEESPTVVMHRPAPAPQPEEPPAESAPEAVARRVTARPVLPPDPGDDAFQRGRSHLNRGAYADAIAAFTEALTHSPAHHDAHFSRGMAHHLSGRYRDALVDYTEAIKRRADHAAAYLLRGRVHRTLGALDRALADFGEAIKLRPDHAPSYLERGRLNHHTGDYAQAIADYDAAIRLRPNDAAPYYHRGLVRYHAGDARGAIRDFDHALQLAPKLAAAYLARSEAYARLGQYARAAADHDTFDHLGAAR
jgi:tetratricopeptide (TPR) repeat protein/serine/threonine protein kinase